MSAVFLPRERIYFGHQSVGANLLQGVAELAAEEGVPIRIVRADRASELPAAAFGHTFVPDHGLRARDPAPDERADRRTPERRRAPQGGP